MRGDRQIEVMKFDCGSFQPHLTNRVNKYRGVKYKSTRAFGFAEG